MKLLRLIQSGKQTSEYLDSLARMYCEHMDNCRDNALKLYDQVLVDEAQNKGETYYESLRGRMILLIDIGEGDRMIQECHERIEADPENVENHNTLIAAYKWTKHYKKALEVAEATIAKFPDNYYAYGRAAGLYKAAGRYEEAFAYWDKEFELCPRWSQALYAKAFYYQKLGRKQEELKQWREIVVWLEARNAYIETAMPKENIGRLEQEGVCEA